jgi:O-antigen biosynthesis protein
MPFSLRSPRAPRSRQPWELSKLDHLVPVALDEALCPVDPPLPADRDADQNTWLFVAPGGGKISREVFSHLSMPALAARPDVGIFYSDSAEIRGGRPIKLHCKPSFNLSLLFAQDYIGFPLIIRASVFAKLRGLRLEFGRAAWYDFCLRAQEAGIAFERIPVTLAGIPAEQASASVDERRAALERLLREHGHPFDVMPGRTKDSFRLARRFETYPQVSLVIPTRQSRSESGSPYIVDLLNSIARSSWPAEKISVVIGDDVEADAIYQRDRWPFTVKRIITRPAPGQPFNYARKMNTLWRAAESNLLVLMNDDMVVRTPDWLEALFTFALEEDVGGVGARLLFPDDRIQHAGMVGGLFGGCAHPWFGKPAGEDTYGNWADVHRDWSVVTGAVFATRKSVLEAANGFDERFSLEFNDVDLCLRLKMLGYRIVYTPHAELTHYEKSSRGDRLPPGEEVALFLKRWRDFINDDPAYNPQLAMNTFEVRPKPESFGIVLMP